MVRNVHAAGRRDRKKALRGVGTVTLNGVDVTTSCGYADDRRGLVRLFARNADGRFFLNAAGTGPVVEERRGRVRIWRNGGALKRAARRLTIGQANAA